MNWGDGRHGGWRIVTAAVVLSLIALGLGALRIGLGAGSSLLSSQWHAYRCPEILAADLAEIAWDKEPIVEKCIGDPREASCFVSMSEDKKRERFLLQPWDCTRRHVRDGLRVDTLRHPGDERIAAEVTRAYEGILHKVAQIK